MSYFISVLASFSVVLNAITGGGYRNTFSARTGYAASMGAGWALKAEVAINSLPFFSDNHCRNEAINEGLM